MYKKIEQKIDNLFKKDQQVTTRLSPAEILPAEIWVLILCYLDAKSIMSIAKISKYFNQISKTDAIWKEKCDEKGFKFSSQTIPPRNGYRNYFLTSINIKHSLDICVSGHQLVKKSQLISIFVNEESELEFKSTVGIDFQNKELNIEGERIQIKAWDMSSNEKFNRPVYRRAQGIFFAFNLENRETFNRITEVSNLIKSMAEESCKYMILAIYEDKSQQCITNEEIETLSKQLAIPYLIVDLNNLKQVNNAFTELATQITEPRRLIKNEVATNVNDLPEKEDKKCSVM